MRNPKGGRPRGGIPKAELIAREQEIVKLRRGGLTWDLIGERLGIHLTTAQKAYERALRRVVIDDVEAIRKLETERLDLAQSAIWGKVLQGDNPSVANLLRIMERRAKLLGLDMPTRIQAEVVTYDRNSIESRLAEIIAYAGGSDSSSALPVGTDSSQTESDTTVEP